MATNNPTLAEKQYSLRIEFQKMDLNHDEFLSQDELFKCLDKQIGKEFDRNVALQLFERMDKDYDNRITIDEFIKVFLEAEEILKNKIDNSKKYLEDYNRQRQEAKQKLEEMRNTERMNNYGIMEGSTLNVNVQEAQDIKNNQDFQSADAYCTVTVGSITQQTRVSHALSPIWNESFTFPIETGMETLQIVILDWDTFQKNDIISQVQIPLNALRDQNKHDDWHPLQDKNGQTITKGKIHLILQWVHSRVQYLSTVVKKWDEHIKLQHEDLIDYEKDLSILYEPFSSIVNMYRTDNQGYFQEKTTNRGATPQFDMMTGGFSQDKIKAIVSNTVRSKAPQVCTVIYLLIAALICFNRAVFIDLVIGICFFMFYQLQQNSVDKMKQLLVLLGFSIILDLVWLILYSSHYWMNTVILTHPAHSKHMDRFVIAFSFLLIFYKVFLAIMYYLHLRNMQKGNKSNVNSGGGADNSPNRFDS